MLVEHITVSRQPARRGFTLLELLLVIALLAVLAAVVWPNLPGRLAGEQLMHSARQLQSVLYLTRASALEGVLEIL